MPMIHAGAANRYNVEIEEKDYQVVDGVEFMQKYLFPDPEKIRDHFELKAFAYVAGPGSGKSTTTRFVVDFIRNVWGTENVNAMITDNVQLAMENMNDQFVQLIVVDDAIKNQDSRRSMSDANVTATQQFMLIRHVARQIARGGIIYAMFCFQDPRGIDVRFRNVCDIIFYKAWFDQCGLESRLKDKDMITFLKKVTREQKLNNYEYRQYSVGHTSWGDLVAMKTPFVPEEGFQLRQITTEGKKEQIKCDLIDKLIEIDLVDEPIQTVYGYLFDLKTRDHVLDLYNFGQGDFKEIIYRAKAKLLLDGSTATKNETYMYKLWKYIQGLHEISFQDLEDITGVPHSVMHRIVSKFKNIPDQDGLTPLARSTIKTIEGAINKANQDIVTNDIGAR